MQETWADKVLLFVATGAGSGYAPVASGTFGTLAALPLVFALGRLSLPLFWVSAAGFVCMSFAAAHRAGQIFGASDDGRIVVDEFAGFMLTMALVPFTLKTAALGFVLFRFFDVVKPWPASYFDRRVHNGFGVVLDDLCAGVYARLCLGLWLYFFPA